MLSYFRIIVICKQNTVFFYRANEVSSTFKDPIVVCIFNFASLCLKNIFLIYVMLPSILIFVNPCCFHCWWLSSTSIIVDINFLTVPLLNWLQNWTERQLKPWPLCIVYIVFQSDLVFKSTIIVCIYCLSRKFFNEITLTNVVIIFILTFNSRLIPPMKAKFAYTNESSVSRAI